MTVLPHLFLLLAPVAAEDEALSRQLFGTLTAEASNPVMGSTMGMGSTMQSPGTATPKMSDEELMALSSSATQVSGALVEAFLHKQNLQKGELECMVQGTGSLSGNIMMVSSHTTMLLQQILGIRHSKIPFAAGMEAKAMKAAEESGSMGSYDDGAGDISAKVDALTKSEGGATTNSASSEEPEAQPQAEAGQTGTHGKTATKSLDFFYNNRRLQQQKMSSASLAMSASAVFMELGFSIQRIVKLTHDVVKKCVHGDGLLALQKAGKHMRNMRYLSGHFVANGADVVHELSAALLHWKQNNLTAFGHDLGTALRKVILSNNPNASLPEGMPGKEVMTNVSVGLVNGFFGDGFYLNIDADHGKSPPMHIDLHKCLGDNLKFFQQVWASTMYFFAQRAAGARGVRVSKRRAEKEQAKFGTVLAFTMMQFPRAMRKCNIGKEQEEMLMDAIKGMGGLRFSFETPRGTTTSRDKAEKQLAKTVQAWSDQQWSGFGENLGILLQMFVLIVFKQKYTVDHEGRLRRQLLGLSQIPQPSDGGESSSLLTPALLVLTVVVLLAALVALKSRRTMTAWEREWCKDDTRVPTPSSAHNEARGADRVDPASRLLLDPEAVE